MDFTVFYERLCQQFPDRDKAGEQILPNKISMKRRLADFYQNSTKPISKRRNSTTSATTTSSSQNTSSGTYLWAMDKFRDCVPNLVMVIQKGASTIGGGEGRECVMLEPGKIGPLPMEHPTVQSLTSAVDAKRMTAELMTVMRSYNVPLYDGGALIGIVDYRKGKTPNVLKVWLRPSYTSVILAMRHETAMSVEMEKLLLESLNAGLYLDPEPPSFLGDILTMQSRNRSQVVPKFFANALMSKGESGFDRESTQGAIPIGKLRRMAALEEYRSKEQETALSADQVMRMLSSMTTNQTNSLPAPCYLWRTVQWEKRFEDRPTQFWGLNVYAQPLLTNNNLIIMRMPQLEFLAVLWQGSARPDLMQKVERTTFKTIQMVEQFVAQAKKLMHLEDCGRKIFNEAINPAALRANFYSSNQGMPSATTSGSPVAQKSSSTTGKQNMPKLDRSSSGTSASSTPTKKQSTQKKQ